MYRRRLVQKAFWLAKPVCPVAAALIQAVAALGAAFAAPIGPPAGNGPHLLSNSSTDVQIYFDYRANAATNDPNRIDNITWQTFTEYEFAATEPSGGPSHCSDPDEYFGQALGYPDTAAAPTMVTSGQRGSWTSVTSQNSETTEAETFTSVTPCSGVTLSGLTRTRYWVGEETRSAAKIQRTFRFNKGLGVLANTGLRAFTPRVPMGFHYVLIPNSKGVVVSYDASNCTSSPCTVTDWNGTWIADDTGQGAGLAIFRDRSSSTPAFVGIQSGGSSNANFSSIVLSQPAGGWSGTVTETEYLCPYNQDTWTPAAGTLPARCSISQYVATPR